MDELREEREGIRSVMVSLRQTKRWLVATVTRAETNVELIQRSIGTQCPYYVFQRGESFCEWSRRSLDKGVERKSRSHDRSVEPRRPQAERFATGTEKQSSPRITGAVAVE